MTHHKFMAISVTFLALLLAAPALANGKQPTAAQRRDIERLYDVFGQCGGRTVPGKLEKDWNVRQACALSGKLQDKLLAQGFCFYKRIEVGRPVPLTRQRWEAMGGLGPVPKSMDCVPLHD